MSNPIEDQILKVIIPIVLGAVNGLSPLKLSAGPEYNFELDFSLKQV